jgi:hypothetical protein
MSFTVTARDFDNLSRRAQALIKDFGLVPIGCMTGLSKSTLRRIRDKGLPAKASGLTAIKLIGCLKHYKR